MSKDILLSNHAVGTMRDRHITWDEVHDCILQYESRYESTSHRGRKTPDTYVYQRGTVAVVTHEDHDRIKVITVLLRSTDQWTNEDARNRDGKAGASEPTPSK